MVRLVRASTPRLLAAKRLLGQGPLRRRALKSVHLPIRCAFAEQPILMVIVAVSIVSRRVARGAPEPHLTELLGAFGLARHLHDAAEWDRAALPAHRGNARRLAAIPPSAAR